MSRPGYAVRLRALIVACLALGTMALALGSHAAPTPKPMPETTVRRAWQMAQQAGAYHFSTKVVQTHHPGPALANVGSGATERVLQLEGETDQAAETLFIRMWDESEGQSPDAAIEMRVSGDQAYGRCATCEWQQLDDFYGLYTPGTDVMAYLVGARDIALEGSESRAGIDFTRYSFALDGPAIGAYLRDEMESHLRVNGALPPGVNLEMASVYRDATGDGEVLLRADGLPLRLTINLNVPTGKNADWIEAEIQTDFTRYNLHWAKGPSLTDDPTSWARLEWDKLLRAQRGIARAALQAFATAALILAAILLTRSARKRHVYATLAVSMVVLLVAQPILQNDRVLAYYRQQSARSVDESEDRSVGGELAQETLAASDPLAMLDYLARVGTRALYGEGSINPDADDDGDGLANIEEARLGTYLDADDSDGDGITDDVELLGYDCGNNTWYLDPQNPDTNGDGLSDAQECPACVRLSGDVLPPRGDWLDTDGDGVPDAFDDDNDNDGVHDAVDLSPFSALGGDGNYFGLDNPFKIKVDHVEKDKPLFVDVQIRPEHPDHLSYQFNILDWPSDDYEGQIQRGFDTTFADQVSDGPVSDSFGDMRLIPLLEITIPYKDGSYGNLPVKPGAPIMSPDLAVDDWLDKAKLDPYGITVSKKDDTGALLVHVPLNVVHDRTGGGKEAFAARMAYFPSTDSWGKAHEMRVVWIIQMVVDVCDTDSYPTVPGVEPDQDALDTWCRNPDHRIESVQVVHAYNETWALSGLAVREDHGMNLAVAFEDPGTDDNADLENNLWALALGLNDAFLTARDADDDGQRDITVPEIKLRFDHLTNGYLVEDDEKLWGVRKDALRVLIYDANDLPDEDHLMMIPMTITKEVLADHFEDGGSPIVDQPVLLFAREEQCRTATLDSPSTILKVEVTGDSSFANCVTVDLALSEVPVDTIAHVQWQAYQDDGASGWEPVALEDYYDPLYLRIKDTLTGIEIGPDDLSLEGQVTLAVSFYVGLHHGASGLVQSGMVVYSTEGALRDSQIGPRVGNPYVAIYKLIALKILEPLLEAFKAELNIAQYFPKELLPDGTRAIEVIDGTLDITRGIRQIPDSKAGKLKWAVGRVYSRMGSKAKVAARFGLVVACGLAVAGITVAAKVLNLPVLTHINNSLAVIMATYQLVATVHQISKAVQGISGLVNKMNSVGKNVVNGSMKAGIVGLVIAVVVQWASFIVMWGVSGPHITSLAFTAILAATIAQTVGAVIMFVIACIPIVGQIIMAIVALIDAMVQLVCGILGDTADTEAGRAACKGISGWFMEGIKWVIFGQSLMVDMENEDRLELFGFDQRFVQPELGVSAGNSLAYQTGITTTITLDEIPIDWKAQSFWWQWDMDALKSSAFVYALTLSEPGEDDDKLHETVGIARDDIADWQERDDDFAWIERHIEISTVPLPAPGINQNLSLYLAEAYALPAQECWAAPPPPPLPPYPLIPVCYIRSTKDTAYIDLGEQFKFDVFPETLEAFYELSCADPIMDKDGGYRLAWDESFPRQKDADGDGLKNKSDYGVDPNDSLWDTDQDGLSDMFELRTGSNPEDADADEDGLTDDREYLLGTDPKRADTDGDGLLDGQEVYHQNALGEWVGGWDVVYGYKADGSAKVVHVSSDPTLADADGDGLGDMEERIYGYHPLAPNSSTVLTLESELSEVQSDDSLEPCDGFVAPGQTLRYEATIKNELLLPHAHGLLTAKGDDGLTVDNTMPSTFRLQPQESMTVIGDLTVQAGATSGRRVITQVAGAEVVSPQEMSNRAAALYHLDEDEDSMTFADASGVPVRDATCVSGHCPQSGKMGLFEIERDLRCSDTDRGCSRED